MRLIQWDGFVERPVLEEDVYLQVLKQRRERGAQANKASCAHAGMQEVTRPRGEPVVWKCTFWLPWKSS